MSETLKTVTIAHPGAWRELLRRWISLRLLPSLDYLVVSPAGSDRGGGAGPVGRD